MLLRLLIAGLVMGAVLGAQMPEPEGALGTLPLPPAVGMTGETYRVVVGGIEADRANDASGVAYYTLYFMDEGGVILSGDKDSLTIGGDTDVPLIQWIRAHQKQTPMVLYLAVGK